MTSSDQVVRASSLVEHLDSPLRSDFCLRRQLRNDDLTLLQFFLNHRWYLRSDDPSRVGRSPAELLTGQPHAHWLELPGYTRLSRNWSPIAATGADAFLIGGDIGEATDDSRRFGH